MCGLIRQVAICDILFRSPPRQYHLFVDPICSIVTSQLKVARKYTSRPDYLRIFSQLDHELAGHLKSVISWQLDCWTSYHIVPASQALLHLGCASWFSHGDLKTVIGDILHMGGGGCYNLITNYIIYVHRRTTSTVYSICKSKTNKTGSASIHISTSCRQSI